MDKKDKTEGKEELRREQKAKGKEREEKERTKEN